MIDLAKNPSKNAHEFIIKHFEDIIKAFSDKRITNLFTIDQREEGKDTKVSELAPFQRSTKAGLENIKNSKGKSSISVKIYLAPEEDDDFGYYDGDSYGNLTSEIAKILNSNKTRAIHWSSKLYKEKEFNKDSIFTIGYHICSDKSIVLIVAKLGAYANDDASLRLTYKILEDTDNNKKLIGIREATIFDECVFIGMEPINESRILKTMDDPDFGKIQLWEDNNDYVWGFDDLIGIPAFLSDDETYEEQEEKSFDMTILTDKEGTISSAQRSSYKKFMQSYKAIDKKLCEVFRKYLIDNQSKLGEWYQKQDFTTYKSDSIYNLINPHEITIDKNGTVRFRCIMEFNKYLSVVVIPSIKIEGITGNVK